MYRVLIADDDPFILEGLKCIVDWQGLGLNIVGTAADGLAAQEILRGQGVDILLTDIRMPRMDGLELIEWIRREHLPVRCVVLSGYDDYPYLQRGLKLGIENYLVKSINENELTETLEAVVAKLEKDQRDGETGSGEILRDNVLERWMLGRIDRGELMERTSLLGLNQSPRAFQVTVYRPEDPRLAAPGRQVAAHWLGEASGGFPQVFSDLDDDVVIIDAGQEAPGGFDGRALLARLTDCLGGAWFGGRGPVSASWQRASESRRVAKRLLGYAMLCPEAGFADAGEAPGLEKPGPAMDMEGLRAALTRPDAEAARRLVNEAFDIRPAPDQCPPDWLTTYAARAALAVLGAAQERGVGLGEVIRNEAMVYEEVRAPRTRRALRDWLEGVLAAYFNQCAQPARPVSPLVRRVLDYTLAHHAQELSLKLLSALFNCSGAYLGRVFKEETGEAFSNYLNRVRVNQACRLLLSTGQSMNQIAAEVGYASTNYFVNVFKKFTGSYPSRYRMEHAPR